MREQAEDPEEKSGQKPFARWIAAHDNNSDRAGESGERDQSDIPSKSGFGRSHCVFETVGEAPVPELC